MKRTLLITIFTLIGFWVYGQATLPIETEYLDLNNLPTGFSPHGLSEYTNNGSKLKFDTEGDYLVINYTGTADVLTFMLGTNNKFTENIPVPKDNQTHRFKVQQSSDGMSYQDLAIYKEGDSQGLQTINNIGPESQYIKFVFDKKATGYNFGLYDIDVTKASPLKINIISFDANINNNEVNVKWETEEEENNDYFVVEWSTDGIDFTPLGKIKSIGYSREKSEYSYTHTNPVKGYNYYRLVQYDRDGTSDKFNAISVLFEQKENSTMYINPNAVYNNLKVEFSTPVVNGRLHIYDTQGKLVKSSILASGIDVFNFDVSTLPAGQYVVKYLDNNKTITDRFLKK